MAYIVSVTNGAFQITINLHAEKDLTANSCFKFGLKCFGKRIQAAYFAPAHQMNPDGQRRYQANRLTVTRQVHYSTKYPNSSIDVMLSLNGMPVATAELRNPLTRQTVENARWQYKNDRNPHDDPDAALLKFKMRALVHLAVDPDKDNAA